MRGLVLLLLILATVGPAQWNSDKQQRWFDAFAHDTRAQTQVANHFWQQQQRSDALYWWRRAADGGSAAALAALRRYFPNNNLQWLSIGVAQGDAAAIKQLADYQLNDANISWQQWQQRWLREPFLQVLGADYGHIVDRLNDASGCKESVTVIASSNADKDRFITLLKQLRSVALPTNQWCFTWQLNQQVRCQRLDSGLRMTCSTPPAQRSIVLADSGKASAHAKQIILTNGSSAEVLAHEIGHWLGLADEYAMAAPLAEAFCRGHYDFEPLNIVVTQQRQLTSAALRELWRQLPWRAAVDDWRNLAQPLPDGRWQLGSSEQAIGLYPADTCHHVEGYTAWKPVKEVTAMERHQQSYWPALYLTLVNQNVMAN